jgi:hypothetical protein
MHGHPGKVCCKDTHWRSAMSYSEYSRLIRGALFRYDPHASCQRGAMRSASGDSLTGYVILMEEHPAVAPLLTTGTPIRAKAGW